MRDGETPGEAASLREAPPPSPLPKSGWRLAGAVLRSWFRLRGGCGFLLLGCGHGGVGDEPLRPPAAGTSPFRGGFAEGLPKGSLRRGSCQPIG